MDFSNNTTSSFSYARVTEPAGALYRSGMTLESPITVFALSSSPRLPATCGWSWVSSISSHHCNVRRRIREILLITAQNITIYLQALICDFILCHSNSKQLRNLVRLGSDAVPDMRDLTRKCQDIYKTHLLWATTFYTRRQLCVRCTSESSYASVRQTFHTLKGRYYIPFVA